MKGVGTIPADSTAWRTLLSRSIVSPGDLPASLGVDGSSLKAVTARYPMRINPYYLRLVRKKGDPIYRQCIPDMREITWEGGAADPLNEEGDAPVPGLTHRYPDRVLFLVSSQCAVYCRFCNRKRKVGRASMVTPQSIREGISYIRRHRRIRDVLLSGGDPLLLDTRELASILQELRSIPCASAPVSPAPFPSGSRPAWPACSADSGPSTSTPTSTTRMRSPLRRPWPAAVWPTPGSPWAARPSSSRGSTTIRLS